MCTQTRYKLVGDPTAPEFYLFHVVPLKFGQRNEVTITFQQETDRDYVRAQWEHTNAISLACANQNYAVADVNENGDGPFAMDTQVPAGKRVVLQSSMLGAPKRKDEPEPMAQVLKELGFDVRVCRSPTAKFEGGDFFDTRNWLPKRRFFGGLGVRTNTEGMEFVRRQIHEVHGSNAVLDVIVPPAEVRIHTSSTSGFPGLSSNGDVYATINVEHWGEEGAETIRKAGIKVIPTRGCFGAVARIGGKVMVMEGDPRLCDQLTDAGFDVLVVPFDALAEGEAGPHCIVSALIH